MPDRLDVQSFLLVIPDDRGGLGFTDVGKGVWWPEPHDSSGRTVVVWCHAPREPGAGKLQSYVFCARTPSVWELVAGWLEYAVTDVQGNLIAIPKGVWKYERKSNIWAGERGLDPFAELGL